MDRFSSILATIPFSHFQDYIHTFNLSANDYSVMMSIFAAIMGLLAFARAGMNAPTGFSDVDSLYARLDKAEVTIADFKNRFANALSMLEMELKGSQHDVAEVKKIIEIVFSKRAGTGATAVDYEEYHSRPAGVEDTNLNMRGAPLNVRVSQKQDGYKEEFSAFKK